MEARVESTIWLNFTGDLCTPFAGGHAELELLLLRCPLSLHLHHCPLHGPSQPGNFRLLKEGQRLGRGFSRDVVPRGQLGHAGESSHGSMTVVTVYQVWLETVTGESM